MEEELRCFLCNEFYRDPVLLTCGHALCRVCALSIQSAVPDDGNAAAADYQEADKASVTSETDSGVVCGSRPSSYAGTPAAPASCTASFTLNCPICKKQLLLDEHGAEALPPFRVMRTIVERFSGIAIAPPAEEACQMCEGDRKTAVVRCEQCSVRYCAGCRDAWHPIRGPLAQHELRPLGTCCAEHGAIPSIFCNICQTPICTRCMNERHAGHETQPLASAARIHKTELSQSLQHLSEEAKSLTEHIQSITGSGDNNDESWSETERAIEAACGEVARVLEQRREELVRVARSARGAAAAQRRAARAAAAQRLREATALLHFSIEALKETDSAAFLQVSGQLQSRARAVALDVRAAGEQPPAPGALTLHAQPALDAIQDMNFIECMLPGAPQLVLEQCAARGCSCTVAWRPPPGPAPRAAPPAAAAAPAQAMQAAIRGYVLELDDGLGGPFREVYRGRETLCTVEGLQHASLYRARVRAEGGGGTGPASQVVGLQTSPVAWFSWESASGSVWVSDDRRSAHGSSWQPAVLLADTPLSRGRHYWTLTLDEYDGEADPAFGVARVNVARDKILGSDALGWSMYVDGARSRTLHGGAHGARRGGGAGRGGRVGLLLDLTRGTLRYTLDQRPLGDVAFSGLVGPLYPAVSLSRGVRLTLSAGLEPPDLHD